MEKYEDEHYPVPLPDAIEAVKLKMQEKGIKSKGLVGKIGSKSYIPSLLNKKKLLTPEIAKVFYREPGGACGCSIIITRLTTNSEAL